MGHIGMLTEVSRDVHWLKINDSFSRRNSNTLDREFFWELIVDWPSLQVPHAPNYCAKAGDVARRADVSQFVRRIW
jgi:hypothetical protein